MFLIPVEVECHAGYKGDEEPRAFCWGKRRIRLVDILDRWYQEDADPREPSADYYRASDSDGKEHLLKHSHEPDGWYLVENFKGR